MRKEVMRKAIQEKDTMRREYDFSRGVRGKHVAKYQEGTNVVDLEPEMAREPRTAQHRKTSSRRKG
jgi:hypothetical protein